MVVAIEPSPPNLECLRRNLCDEIEAGRVIVYPKGLWDKEEALPIYRNQYNTAADSFVLQGNGTVSEHLELTTIDKLTEELALERVDLIKLDIKGAVPRALLGARALLQRDRPRLVIAAEEDSEDPVAVRDLVESFSLDYQVGCGTCFLNGLTVEPYVLFFSVPSTG